VPPARPLGPELAFATPRKLPKATDLRGRVVVLDVAFASEASGGGFDKLTRPFLDSLGDRLAGWIDHHDHRLHASYSDDSRFVLATKAEHGACPEMVTTELVRRIGPVDTIVSDDDARAIDTRTGIPSPTAQRFDRALRARPRDTALFGLIVRHLSHGLEDASLWQPIDAAAAALAPIEAETRRVAAGYTRMEVRPRQGEGAGNADSVAFVDATKDHGKYDKTMLLLLGQERAAIAMVVDRDTLTLAARFDSGISFLTLLGLSGGMPTLVSVQKERLLEALDKLGVNSADVQRIVG
jgi:hypothetical protein